MNNIADIKDMISDTPVLEIEFEHRGKRKTLFAKAEYYNLTGSIKDRIALYIMERAYETGAIRPGDTVCEATSGNTGISFAAVAAYLGHPCVIFMPDWMCAERKDMMRGFGADLRLVSKEEGGFVASVAMADEYAKENNAFVPHQFSNPDNVRTHQDITGPEILRQLKALGRVPDAVIAGVGTGGTIMGLSRCFKAVNPACKAFPLEPSNSPTLSTGYQVGHHRIQGISDEFIPDIVKLDELDAICDVDDGDSIIMAQRLARELGVGVGISSGANFIGAVKMMEQLDDDACMVTIFADDNKKYLTTDYAKEIPVGDDFISPEIKLLSYTAHR